MKTQTYFKAFLTLAFFFTLSANLWAQQTIPDGTPYSPEKAEQYLTKWDGRVKLEYFSINSAANENIQTVYQKNVTNVDHVRIAIGKIGDEEYLFIAGVSTEGKVVGDYFVSYLSAGLGPCPNNCD